MQTSIQTKLREQNLKSDTYNCNCSGPCKSSKSFSNYVPFLSNNSVIVDNQQSNTIYILLKTLSPARGKVIPTWAAYNSLMGQKKPLTNVAMLPIINGSPRERDNLYASIKEAEKLRRKIFKDSKTMISFELQKWQKRFVCFPDGWITQCVLCSEGNQKVDWWKWSWPSIQRSW